MVHYLDVIYVCNQVMYCMWCHYHAITHCVLQQAKLEEVCREKEGIASRLTRAQIGKLQPIDTVAL